MPGGKVYRVGFWANSAVNNVAEDLHGREGQDTQWDELITYAFGRSGWICHREQLPSESENHPWDPYRLKILIHASREESAYAEHKGIIHQ